MGGGVRSQRSQSGLPKEMEAQGLGHGTLLPLPSQRQTDGRTGETGHRENSERWTWDELKGEKKQTEQIKPSFRDPPDPSPPFLWSPLPTYTHKFETYKGRTGDRGQYRSEKREGRGLRSPRRTLHRSLPHRLAGTELPHCPG